MRGKTALLILDLFVLTIFFSTALSGSFRCSHDQLSTLDMGVMPLGLRSLHKPNK